MDACAELGLDADGLDAEWGKAKKAGRETRYYKNVGLGIKTPRAAIDGTYVDRKCPWTGAPAALER